MQCKDCELLEVEILNQKAIFRCGVAEDCEFNDYPIMVELECDFYNVNKVLNRLAKALQIIKELEWVEDRVSAEEFCPSCHGWIEEGHDTDCPINNILLAREVPEC